MSDKSLVFVSYRRDDSQAWTTLIVDSLQRHFGRDAVFLDAETIRAGEEWPDRVRLALDQAAVFLVVIGPQWLSVHDGSWRRRIDLADDWVRREIEYALTHGKALVPVLVSGASIPRGEALPSSLVELPNRQAIRLEDKKDIRELVEFLVSHHGFQTIVAELDYPTPHDRVPELPEVELGEALSRLPEWSRIERDSSKGKGGIAVELERVYKFKTFEDAMHFMATAARYVRVTEHHPLWENQYQDIRVRISTWDVGLRLTWKDIRLSEYLDRLYLDYVVFDSGGKAAGGLGAEVAARGD